MPLKLMTTETTVVEGIAMEIILVEGTAMEVIMEDLMMIGGDANFCASQESILVCVHWIFTYVLG